MRVPADSPPQEGEGQGEDSVPQSSVLPVGMPFGVQEQNRTICHSEGLCLLAVTLWGLLRLLPSFRPSSSPRAAALCATPLPRPSCHSWKPPARCVPVLCETVFLLLPGRSHSHFPPTAPLLVWFCQTLPRRSSTGPVRW